VDQAAADGAADRAGSDDHVTGHASTLASGSHESSPRVGALASWVR
jgi:hypothetical protein